MPLPLKPFYMIRHGESTANRDGFFSGNLDVPLTQNGIMQAEKARLAFEDLPQKPTQIISSHLSRAIETAKIMNQNLRLPMHQTPQIGEHHFGDWETEPWGEIRPLFHQRLNPPNGETHEAFHARIKTGLTTILEQHALPLIVCHGGVFRAFYSIYRNSEQFKPIDNAQLYRFDPDHNTSHFPWQITWIE